MVGALREHGLGLEKDPLKSRYVATVPVIDEEAIRESIQRIFDDYYANLRLIKERRPAEARESQNSRLRLIGITYQNLKSSTPSMMELLVRITSYSTRCLSRTDSIRWSFLCPTPLNSRLMTGPLN